MESPVNVLRTWIWKEKYKDCIRTRKWKEIPTIMYYVRNTKCIYRIFKLDAIDASFYHKMIVFTYSPLEALY